MQKVSIIGGVAGCDMATMSFTNSVLFLRIGTVTKLIECTDSMNM